MTLEDDCKRIAQELRAMGLSEDEVMHRLDRFRLSNSPIGTKSYDPITDSFERLRADGLPPLLSFEENKVAEQIARGESLNSGSGLRLGIFTVKSANQTALDASKQADPKDLFWGLLYQGEHCIMFGDSYAGKSLLAVQIASGISLNEAVLLFDFELSDKQFQLRYSDGNGDLYKFPDKFFRVSLDPDGLEVADNFEEMLIKSIEQAAKELKVTVLVIDNLTWLASECEKAEAAAKLMKALWALTRKHGWTILTIAHTPKRNMSNPLTQNDLAGSKRLFNFCDGCFAIGRSARDENERYLKQLKCRSSQIKYHGDNVLVCKIVKKNCFTYFEAAGYANEKELLKDNTLTEDERVLRDAVYELADQGLSCQAIANQLAISKSRAWRILDKRRK